MQYSKMKKRNKGFALLELALSTVVILILLTAAGLLFNQSRRFNQACLARQQCAMAALAQLDSLEYTGEPLSPDSIARLWPRVNLTLTAQPAPEPWRDLVEVSVRAECGPMTPAVYVLEKRFIPASALTVKETE